AAPVAGGARLRGGHARRGQLRLGQPAVHRPSGPASLRVDPGRERRVARAGPGLRRGPQHRQVRDSRSLGARGEMPGPSPGSYEGRDTLREETSEAYKDVAHVVRVVEGADLAKPVARLRPFIVVKG